MKSRSAQSINAGQNYEGSKQERRDRARARKHHQHASASASTPTSSSADALRVPAPVEHAVRDLLGQHSNRSDPPPEPASAELLQQHDRDREQAPRNPDVSENDLRSKVASELEKKGFASSRIQQAIASSFALETDADRSLNFNQQRRRLLDNAKDWLSLNLDPSELPDSFNLANANSQQAEQQRRGGYMRGRSKRGHGRASCSQQTSKSPVVTAPTREASQLAHESDVADSDGAASKQREAMLDKEQKRVAVHDYKVRTSHNARNASEQLKEQLERKRKNDLRYIEMLEQRQSLPAWAQRQPIVDAVASQQVTIIAGDTGCGKTTQVPQLILDERIDHDLGAATNIICTQPRRVAATSVASRVAQERAESLGNTFGYQIRLESCKSSSTRCLFSTTGILLRRLQEDPLLSGVSHIVLDEVHERSLETDFLLVLLLKEILPRRPSLKLVCMSATLDAAAFERYFQGHFSCSTLSIPGRQHPVRTHHLEDVIQLCAYEPQEGSECLVRDGRKLSKAESGFMSQLKERGYANTTLDALKKLDIDQTNLDLAALLIWNICVHNPPGAIVVFLPGLSSIEQLHEKLLQNDDIKSFTSGGSYLLPLHSSLSSADQAAVFHSPPNGVRKIVMSTNIAETSVTVPDVVYVVDSGKQKLSGYNPEKRMQTLDEGWISQASSKQRRGRAGRVQPGVAFRLYTTMQHSQMREHEVPEIQRVPLEGLCLQMKLQRIPSVKNFLSAALDPPSAAAIDTALGTLKLIGALDESASELSNMGKQLAQLPLDVHIGKLLLHACLLECLDPCLTIAAFLSSRSPFVAPFNKRKEAHEAKQRFKIEQSDHLCVLEAFNDWCDVKGKHGKKVEKQFLERNFLSRKALQQMSELRAQFVQNLRETGFLSQGGVEAASRQSSDKGLIKCALVSGLYPNIVRIDPFKPQMLPFFRVLGESGYEELVQIHPSSVNAEEMHFKARWLVYFERVQSSTVYVRDCTPVTGLQLLLFGGSIAVQHGAGTITMDGWATFPAQARVAALVRMVRNSVDQLFSEKFSNVAQQAELDGTGKRKAATVEAIQCIVNGR